MHYSTTLYVRLYTQVCECVPTAQAGKGWIFAHCQTPEESQAVARFIMRKWVITWLSHYVMWPTIGRWMPQELGSLRNCTLSTLSMMYYTTGECTLWHHGFSNETYIHACTAFPLAYAMYLSLSAKHACVMFWSIVVDTLDTFVP